MTNYSSILVIMIVLLIIKLYLKKESSFEHRVF